MSTDQDQMANDWAAAMAEQSSVEATELEDFNNDEVPFSAAQQ